MSKNSWLKRCELLCTKLGSDWTLIVSEQTPWTQGLAREQGETLVTLMPAGMLSSKYRESADRRAPSSVARADSRTLRSDWSAGDGMNDHIWSLRCEETADRKVSNSPPRNWSCSKSSTSITRELFIVSEVS